MVSPEGCERLGGLLGLDRGMFQDPEIFEIGLIRLRHPDRRGRCGVPAIEPELPSEILGLLVKKRLLSQIDRAMNEGLFNAGFFRFYAAEIERRAEIKTVKGDRK